jgi:hypothetical protein
VSIIYVNYFFEKKSIYIYIYIYIYLFFFFFSFYIFKFKVLYVFLVFFHIYIYGYIDFQFYIFKFKVLNTLLAPFSSISLYLISELCIKGYMLACHFISIAKLHLIFESGMLSSYTFLFLYI